MGLSGGRVEQRDDRPKQDFLTEMGRRSDWMIKALADRLQLRGSNLPVFKCGLAAAQIARPDRTDGALESGMISSYRCRRVEAF